MKYLILIMSTILMSQVLSAKEIEIGQKNKQFSESKVTIKKGDTIKFTNEDPFFHNIFSLSEIQFFDLGSYPKGEFKTVEFPTVGTVEVECAIHPDMKMTVEVTE